MKKAFTHSGVFHADDVFASAFLNLVFTGIDIQRGRQVPENFEGIVFDIGGGKFDHHQEDKEFRENGVPYAAFGLLWREYGTEILCEEDAKQFDLEFVQPIDKSDNMGEQNMLCSVIADMNPAWNEKERSEDAAFEEAVRLARTILERKFISIRAQRAAFCQMKELVEKTKGNVLEMEQAMPWKKAVCGSEVEFVIFPSSRGGYMVQAVPIEEHSQILRHPFPEQWRGKAPSQLQKLTGIETFHFCHGSGFICAVGTLEDARKVVRMA